MYQQELSKTIIYEKVACLIILTLLVTTIQCTYAQPATDKKQQFASIGDFLLENGQKIIDCKVGYRTLGKLNEKQSNAIIYPTPGGVTTYMMELFGVTAFLLLPAIATASPGFSFFIYKRLLEGL